MDMLPAKRLKLLLFSVTLLWWTGNVNSEIGTPTCHLDDNITTVELFYPQYTSYDKVFPAAQTCYDECMKMGEKYAGLSEASFCYCSEEASTWPTGTCDASCADATQCGGVIRDTMNVYELTEVPAVAPEYMTISKANEKIAVGATSTAVVTNSSGDYVLDHGSGSGRVTTLDATYHFAGIYETVGILQDAPNKRSNVVRVKVVEPVDSTTTTLECTTNMTIGDEGSCVLNMTRQGTEFKYKFELKTTAETKTIEGNIPDEVTQFVGSTKNGGQVTSVDLSNSLVMIPTPSTNEGYITDLLMEVGTAGNVGIYVATPTCSQQVYCGRLGKCVDTCNDGTEPITCSEMACPLGNTCKVGDSCTSGTDPCSGYTIKLLTVVDVTVGEFIHELPEPPNIKYGERIVVGCDGSDCASPANIQARDLTLLESGDMLISDPGSCVLNVNAMDYRILARFVIRQHKKFVVETNYTCETATPVLQANVPDRAIATAESFINESDLSYIYEISNELTASEFTQEGSILCQEVILTPSFSEEVTMKLGTPYPYEITFSQGAPVFTTFMMDGTQIYDYQDKATGGWTYQFDLDFAKGGHYPISLTSKNAISEVSYSFTVHAIPPVTDTWTATFGCPCYDIDEGFSLTVDFPSAENPPWTADATFTFGTESFLPGETIDFETEPKNGTAEALVIEKTVVYKAGQHTATIVLKNSVSETTITKEVEVLAGIRDVSMTLNVLEDGEVKPPLSSGSVFLSNSTILFNLSTATGNPEKWRCVVTEPPETTEIVDLSAENMTMIFQEDGDYEVTCAGYNSVQGWVDSPPLTIKIVSEIQGFTITKGDDILGPGKEQPIFADFVVFTPLSCTIIKYGDETMEGYGDKAMCDKKYPEVTYKGAPTTSPFSVSHVYANEGKYTVSGLAYDKNLTDYVYEVEILVMDDVQCTTPVATITNAVPLVTQAPKQFKSLARSIEGSHILNCTKEYPKSENWRIEHVENITGTPFVSVNVDDWPTRNQSKLMIRELALEYGLYRATYGISLLVGPDMYLTNTDLTFFEVVATPLVSRMMDGSPSTMTRGFGQRIEFDGLLSYDPDEPTVDNSLTENMNFTWFCRRIGAGEPGYPVDLDSVIYEPTDFEKIPSPGVAMNKVNGGCFGEGILPLEVKSNTFIFVTSSFVDADSTYEFALQISKNGRLATSYMQVIVTPTAPPAMAIECEPSGNCISFGGKLWVTPTSSLGFKGSCVSDCTQMVSNSWDIVGSEGEALDLTQNCGPTSPSDCKALVSDMEKDSVTFSKDFLMKHENVKEYRVRFTGKGSGGTEGFTETTITINNPPSFGKCSLGKEEGKTLLTTFELVCENWQDPEEMGGLVYSFYYNDENGVKKLLYTSQNSRTELVLPYGVETVYADITDKLGAVTTVVAGNVNVTLPTQEEVEQYNKTAVIAELNAKGDTKTATMVQMAFSSIRDNANYFSLDAEALEGLTSDELTERKLTLAYSVRSQLDDAKNLPLETSSDVLQATTVMANGLGGIFLNAESATNFDLHVKETAMSLALDISRSLPYVDIKNLEIFIPIMTNIMDSMSALICSSTMIVQINQFPPSDLGDASTLEYDTALDGVNTTVPDNPEQQLINNILLVTKLRSKEQVYQILDTVHVMFVEILKRMRLGESLVSHSANYVSIMISYVSEEVFKEEYILDATKNLGSKVTFPKQFCPSKFNDKNTECNSHIQVKFIVWPCIPFYYPFNRRLISPNSRVITVELYSNGRFLNIVNSKKPIEMLIPKEREDIQAVNVTTSRLMNDISRMFYYRFFLEPQQTSFVVTISTDNNMASRFVRSLPNDDINTLTSSSQFRNYPSNAPNSLVLFYDHKRMPLCSRNMGSVQVNSLKRDSDGRYRLFVGLNETEEKRGSFYLGVAELADGVVYKPNMNCSASDLKTDVSVDFNVRISAVSCYHFDEFLQEWSNEGVKVTDSTETLTKCESNRLGSFAIGNFPLPNDLDFEYIFANAGFIDNVTLYSALIVVTCLFLILFIWGHYMDRKDEEKRGAVPLPDNKKEDQYLYEMSIETGADSEASTNSNIMFIMSGDYDETSIRTLPPANKELYKRFDVNLFVVATSGPLGCINYLRMLHDNSGEPPLDSWQVQSVVIRDLQTNEKFLFKTDSWLAFNRMDGSIDRTFNRTVNADSKSFSDHFYTSGNRILNQDHIWLSIFMRPACSRYSRKERVGVCALFMYLSMLCSAMWYNTTSESPLDDAYKFSVFSLNLERFIIGLVVLLAVFPIITLLIMVFKRARPRNLRRCRAIEAIEEQRAAQFEETGIKEEVADTMAKVEGVSSDRPKETSRVRCLPWWTRILAWIVMLGGIGASIFFVWSYGVMWGEIKTIKWFSSFIISFVVSLLVIQFVKVFIFTCVSAAMGTYDHLEDTDCDEELPKLKKDESWKHGIIDDSSGRKVHEIEGVDYHDPFITSMRTKLMKQREMYHVVKGIMVYFIFLAILVVISYNRTDINALLMKESLTNSFIKEGHLKWDFKNKVKNTNEWWSWCKAVLMKELRAQNHYNGAPPLGLKGFIGDHSNRIMGHAIIRQIRSNHYGCQAPDPLHKIITSCSGIRGMANEDHRSYCIGWRTNSSSPNGCLSREFKYSTADELQTFMSSWKLGYYGGGGYAFHLNESESAILKKMDDLHANKWVDRNTRALIIEFSVYNPNVNLFAVCTIIAEFEEGGGVIPSWRFEPIRLIQNTDWTGTLNTICEYLFCAAIIYFTLINLWEMKKLKCAYFDSYWNLAELFIIMLSYITIAFYVYKYIQTAEVTAEFDRTKGNTYIRMDSAATYDQYSIYFFGFIMFFSIIKMIKLLQFNKRMNALALTIGLCWEELKIFLIAFAIVFFAFSCLFFFMFTGALEQFSTIVDSVQTSFTMMLGKFDYEAMNQINPMSPLLFFVFSLLNVMILLNIMLTIIIQAFRQVKEFLISSENRLDVVDYVWTSFRQHLRKERFTRVHVEPKLNDKLDHDGNHTSSAPREKQTKELPGKVGQLLEHINHMYFDGKLDVNDPYHKKAFLMPQSDVYGGYPDATDNSRIMTSD